MQSELRLLRAIYVYISWDIHRYVQEEIREIICVNLDMCHIRLSAFIPRQFCI